MASTTKLGALGLLALVLLATIASAEEAFVPGKTYEGTDGFVAWVAGELPVVLPAPHGGKYSVNPCRIPGRMGRWKGSVLVFRSRATRKKRDQKTEY